MTQPESYPGRPPGRRARPDNDVPEWAGYDGRSQAPWDHQPWPSQEAPQQAPPSEPALSGPAQTGPAQTGPAQTGPVLPGPVQPRRARSRAAHSDSDPMEAFSERWRRRGSESRGERRADRRKRRRLMMLAGGALAVVIAVSVYFLTGGGGGSAANLGLNSLVTTFLPGELQQVPNACNAVPGATLTQYLPGQLKVAVPPLNAGANSQCTWTLDKAPMYRVLEVNLQAYSPSGLASGDGSATFAAQDAYSELESAKLKPGPRSGQPQATVTDLAGMPGGKDTSAFMATQVFNVNGAITDVATVDVRYRNVIVTVVLNGLDHANKGNYGPVSQADLNSAAQTVAQEVTGTLVH